MYIAKEEYTKAARLTEEKLLSAMSEIHSCLMTLMEIAIKEERISDAEYIAEDLNYVWGSDVRTSMINALMECAVSGTDIDSRFEQLQKELTALIG